MTAIVGPFELPLWMGGMSPTLTGTTPLELDASNDAVEFIFQVPEPMTITRVGFRQVVVTGTAPTYKASLQGVSSDTPDGTIKGGGSPASVTFQPTSGGNNAWHWYTLANPYTATRGEFLALVVAYDSGTINGSNKCSFSLSSSISPSVGLPYSISNNGGSRTKNPLTPIFGVGTASQAYGLPISTVSIASLSDATTPDEKGNLITIPSTLFGQYSISGVAWYGQSTNGSTYELRLYDTAGNVLQSVAINATTNQVGNSTRKHVIYFDEATLATLAGGTSYRLVIRPTNSTAIAFGALVVASSDDHAAYLGGSSMCQLTTRTNDGIWTDDPTSRCAINPIISAVGNAAFPPIRRVA